MKLIFSSFIFLLLISLASATDGIIIGESNVNGIDLSLKSLNNVTNIINYNINGSANLTNVAWRNETNTFTKTNNFNAGFYSNGSVQIANGTNKYVEIGNSPYKALLVNGNHKMQIIADGSTQSPLTLIGGSAEIQIWKDGTPTKAVGFGMAVPGTASTDDWVFSIYDGYGWNEAMRITNANRYVGIGTSSPQTSLHVVKDGTQGSMPFQYETAVFERPSDNKLGVYGSGTASVTLGETYATNGNGYYPSMENQFVNYEFGGYLADPYMRFNYLERDGTGTAVSSKTDILHLRSSGKVGINNANPTSTLEVNDAYGNPLLAVGDGSSLINHYLPDKFNYAFTADTTYGQYVLIQGDPAVIQFDSSGTTSYSSFYFTENGGAGQQGAFQLMGSAYSDANRAGNFEFINFNNKSLTFMTQLIEGMRLNGDNHLLIGTMNDDTSGALLQVAGNANISGTLNTNSVIATNLNTRVLSFQSAILGTCNAGARNYMRANSSGTYGCNSTTWVRLF